MTLSAGISSLVAIVLSFLTGGIVPSSLPHYLSETEEATSGFSVLGDIDALGGYEKREGGVFYRNERVEGADSATFTVIDPYYAKDAKRVYFNLEPMSPSSTVSVLAGADPRTFGLCDSSDDKDDCVKDAQRVYLEGKVVAGADPRTFTALDSYYGKDAKNVYYGGVVLAGADPRTFTTVTGNAAYDAKDKNAMYLRGRAVSR